MKNLIFALLLAVSAVSYSQDRDYRFSAYATSDPFVYGEEEGFNIGLGIDYKMSVVYFDVQIKTAPDYNGVSYFDFTATPLGFNFHITNQFDEDVLRFFAGSRLGVIYRGGLPNATYGAEGGIDYFFPNSNFFIGSMVTYNFREDLEQWEGYTKESDKWSLNFEIKIGVRF